jgi:hypothetical protein
MENETSKEEYRSDNNSEDDLENIQPAEDFNPLELAQRMRRMRGLSNHARGATTK